MSRITRRAGVAVLAFLAWSQAQPSFSQGVAPGPLPSEGFEDFRRLLAPPPELPPGVNARLKELLETAREKKCSDLTSFEYRPSLLAADLAQTEKPPCVARNALEHYFLWQQVALDSTAIDHAPSARGVNDGSLRQLGPHRSSRAMALVHLAMYNAVLGTFVQQGPAHAAPPVPDGRNAKEALRYQFYDADVLPSKNFRLSAPAGAQIGHAIAAAAHCTLAHLYPQQWRRLDEIYADVKVEGIPATGTPGEAFGRQVALDILYKRNGDGSSRPEPVYQGEVGEAVNTPPAFTLPRAPTCDPASRTPIAISNDPPKPDLYKMPVAKGKWSPDPISGVRVALGAWWSSVRPFAIKHAADFRPAPPPSLSDASYVRDYDEVKRIGSLKSTERRDSETFVGRFWAYDGVAALCAPPRLYNQIVRALLLTQSVESKVEAAARQKINELGESKDLIAQEYSDVALEPAARLGPARKNLPADRPPERVNGFDVVDVARIFGLVNLAMADAAISAWEAKYFYKFWRPVTGIRAGASDDNSLTVGDATWQPLGAPATNSGQQPNFTPPFPAYPSGHAVFGGAVFETMRRFFPESTTFGFRSDEYNGLNFGFLEDKPRPDSPQTFVSLSHPEYDNARSRVFLGVHWQFDADVGIAQGNQIGSVVFQAALQCLDDKGDFQDCDLKTGLNQRDSLKLSSPASEPAMSGDSALGTKSRGGESIR